MTDPQSFMSDGKLRNYNSEFGAQNYRSDYENKLHRKISDRLERRILHRYFDRIGPCESILDVPCGAGRLRDLLRSRALRVLEADWSHSMLCLNRQESSTPHETPFLRCSALDLPLRDRAVDVVVSIRLSHHLEQAADRERHLRELMRVANKAVIATWFSANSLKNILREARVKLLGKSKKLVMHTSHVRGIANSARFHLASATPLSRLGSGHRFGLFLRR